MTAKTEDQIGSEVYNLIDDIPSTISGQPLTDMVDRKRLYMEDFLGVTIGSTAIADKYQPALFNLAMADLLTFMNVQGADGSYKVDIFSIDKGKGGGALASASNFEAQGMAQLSELKKKYLYYKAMG